MSTRDADDRLYESRHNLFFDTLLRDTRYALRVLARSPGYATAAIVMLALGIGANTAIFSAIDEILFRPPDVPEPQRLAQVYNFDRKTARYVSSSYPDYVDFRQQARSFRSLAAYVRVALTVHASGGVSERFPVEAVSGNYFEMLAVAPPAGRALNPADDATAAAPVAMIAEDLWRTRLHADPAAVGKPIEISGQQFRIVGIVPKRVGGFNLNWVSPPRIWIPLHAIILVIPQFAKVLDSRAAICLVLTGRLRRGVPIASAAAEIRTIAANIAGNRDLTAVVYPLSRSKFWPSYRKDIRTSLTGFGIAAGLILLLACANLSNLLLGRAIVRRRELAMRLAIGAGRGRIIRQLLTESGVLAILSCGAAVLVAGGLMRLLLRFPNALGLTLALDLPIEPHALVFCVALSVLTIALFGLAPSLQIARLAIAPSLKESGNAAAGGRHQWFRGGLVAVQAAFAMILLVGGGLYVRTLWKGYSTDLGFRSDRLLTAEFSIPPPGKQAADRMWNAQRNLLQRLSITPGVVSATVSSAAILSPGRPRARVEQSSGTALTATCEYVGRDFFKTMGIPLLEGQDYTLRDEKAGTAAIVNQTLARSLSSGRSAVGGTILVEAPGRAPSRFLIVGVVGNTKQTTVWEQPEPQIYLPASQSDMYSGFLAVRTNAPPAEFAEPVRKLWNDLMPQAPLYEIQTAGERVDLVLTPQRVAAGILGGFATLALVLTAVGLYSVVAFSVAQQRREIGIRIALGALPGAIFAAVLRRSMLPALAGLAGGAAASLPLMRILAAKATDVSPYDAPTYLVMALLLAVVACGAAIIPACRAMGINPSTTLRSE